MASGAVLTAVSVAGVASLDGVATAALTVQPSADVVRRVIATAQDAELLSSVTTEAI